MKSEDRIIFSEQDKRKKLAELYLGVKKKIGNGKKVERFNEYIKSIV